MRVITCGVGILASILIASCSIATDVDHYVFADSPCPRPARACTGGRPLWFVIIKGDLAREDGMRRLAGFNLDATTDAVCGQRDKISPTGTPGIDNAAAPLLAIIEDPMHPTSDVLLDAVLDGGVVTVVQLNHVDDLSSDDCVDLQLRSASVPFGQDPMTYLDADGDRVVDANLGLEVNSVTARDDRACIVDGILQGVEGDLPTLFPSVPVPVEVDTTALHIRAEVSETRLSNGWQGGGVSVEDLINVLDLSSEPGLVDVLTRSADLYPASDGRCTHLSFAYTFEAIPFVPRIPGMTTP